MQFHCEVDEEKVRDWLVEGAQEMETCVSPGVQQAQALLKSLPQDLAQSQAIASHIYRRWTKGLKT
jgi:hypothetical protein